MAAGLDGDVHRRGDRSEGTSAEESEASNSRRTYGRSSSVHDDIEAELAGRFVLEKNIALCDEKNATTVSSSASARRSPSATTDALFAARSSSPTMTSFIEPVAPILALELAKLGIVVPRVSEAARAPAKARSKTKPSTSTSRGTRPRTATPGFAARSSAKSGARKESSPTSTSGRGTQTKPTSPVWRGPGPSSGVLDRNTFSSRPSSAPASGRAKARGAGQEDGSGASAAPRRFDRATAAEQTGVRQMKKAAATTKKKARVAGVKTSSPKLVAMLAATAAGTPAKPPTRVEIDHQEVVSLGRLHEKVHYSCWAHMWWSESADPLVPYPVGYSVRTKLRVTRRAEDVGDRERLGDNAVRRAGVAFARGRNEWGERDQLGNVQWDHPEHGSFASPGRKGSSARAMSRKSLGRLGWEDVKDRDWDGVVECTIEMPRSGVAGLCPWDGPLFRARWIGLPGANLPRKDWGGDGYSPPEGVGSSQAEALTQMIAARGVGLVTLPKAEAIFGFERGRVADRLNELGTISGAPVRLHSPEGLGLAFVRITEAKAREIRHGRGGDVGNPAPNSWAAKHMNVAVLPGYQVSFELVRGVHICCAYVESANAGMFKITRIEGNAATHTVKDSDPNRAWMKLPMEGNHLRVVKIRERVTQNRTGIGAHLFGLESPRVLEMLQYHRDALALGDEFLTFTAPTYFR